MTDRDTGQITPDATELIQRMGIPIPELTEERFVDILRIYDEVAGIQLVEHAYPGEVEYWHRDMIRRLSEGHQAVEYRFGSRITSHSKLWAQLRRTTESGRAVEFSFDDNLDRGSPVLADASRLQSGWPEQWTERQRAGQCREQSALSDAGRSLLEKSQGEQPFQPEAPASWLPEPDVGRVADGIPHRVDRLRCLGNAIVPKVAAVLLGSIAEIETARE